MSRARQFSLITFFLAVSALVLFLWVRPEMIVDQRIEIDFAALDAIRQAIQAFQKETGSLPTDALGLAQLTAGTEPFLMRVPQDSWGRPYVYRRVSMAPGYELYSAGLNGIDEHGKGDDITDRYKAYSCIDYGIACPHEFGYVIRVTLFLTSLISLSAFVILAVVSGLRGLRKRLPSTDGTGL